MNKREMRSPGPHPWNVSLKNIALEWSNAKLSGESMRLACNRKVTTYSSQLLGQLARYNSALTHNSCSRMLIKLPDRGALSMFDPCCSDASPKARFRKDAGKSSQRK